MKEKNKIYKIIFNSPKKFSADKKDNKVCLPVNPSKIEFKIGGNNKTVDLISGGEINQIKSSKLTEISFEFLLPAVKYPFAYYEGDKFRNPSYFLNRLKKLKKFKLPMILEIDRGKWRKDTTYLPVTIESYTVKEDINNGRDLVVSIQLKQYVDYGYKKIVKRNGKLKVSNRKTKSIEVPKSYTIKKGDTLCKISKKFYGSTAYKDNLYQYNKKVIEAAAKKYKRKSSSKGKYIYPGIKIKLLKETLVNKGKTIGTKKYVAVMKSGTIVK